MKGKTIKAVLNKKINDWIESIEDPKVKQLAKSNTIVTGGCIASMLLQEKVNDYDLYFRTKEAVLALTQYYVDRFEMKNREGIPLTIKVEEKDNRVQIVIKSAGIASEEGNKEYLDPPEEFDPDAAPNEETEEDTGEKYRPVFLSSNAITLSGKIQLVLRFYGEPDEIHKNYDFVHCTNYWTLWDDNLVLHAKALEALLARELVYVGSKYPIASVIRLRKFLKRGFTVNAGQIVKMCMQISELDLTNYAVLADQLTGVDCAYFSSVLARLAYKDPEKINAAYLIEIIDRMF